MSNLEEITLRPIQVERFQAEAALQCIFHTIVFSRSLWSTVKPRDVNCEAFDISYVQNGNPVVARRISTGIRLFLRKLDESKRGEGVACLSFYSVKRTKSWLSTAEKKIVWEEWRLPMVIVDAKKGASIGRASTGTVSDAKRASQRNQSLRDSLMQIVRTTSTKRNHIPPLSQDDPNTRQSGCFGFDVSLLADSESLGGFFKRFFKAGAPQFM